MMTGLQLRTKFLCVSKVRGNWITMLTKILLLGLVCATVTGSHWEKEEKHHAPQPYRFGYEVKDKEGSQYRHEEADGSGSVKGSYGYTDDKGIYREVNYVADKNGFRAEVKTNEPGTSNQDPADVKVHADPQIHDINGVKAIPHIIPVSQKFASPIRPVKKYNNFDTNSYNVNNFNTKGSNNFVTRGYNNFDTKSYNNFSPLHGFRYRSVSQNSFRPRLNVGNNYKANFGRQMGGYKFQVPHYRNNQGLNGFKNINGFKFDDGEIEKIIDELKNKGRYSSNLEGYGNNDEIERMIEEVKNKGRYSDNLNGFNNNDEIEKILDELKNKDGYSSSNFRGLGDNDFEYKEFRNLNGGKSSFSRGYSNDDFDI